MGVFDGKFVWVTGAGSGIGKAAALMFAADGATVVLIGRRREPLDQVAGEVENRGGSALVAPLDVSRRADVQAVTADILAEHGRVDILINNAGTNIVNRRLDEIAPEDWDHVIAVNLTGAFNMFMAVMPAMRDQGDGLVINTGSTAGKRVTGAVGVAYTASKFGLLGMSLSLTQEAWKFGIRACCLHPDDVNTPIMARRKIKYSPEILAQFIQPEDIADTMRMIALMPARSSLPEIIVTPTNIRPYTAVETGTPD